MIHTVILFVSGFAILICIVLLARAIFGRQVDELNVIRPSNRFQVHTKRELRK